MKLIEMNLLEFANEVESLSPAPGGGSCAAYSSLIGTCLTRMMANLSFNKKKYESNDDAVKDKFLEAFHNIGIIKDELVGLVDKDTESYNLVMQAFKFPKETDEEKQVRKEAIEKATWGSIEVPYRVAEISLQAMKMMTPIYEYGNENALTDIGVAYGMLAIGAEGAILNVKINLVGVMDVERAKQLEKKVNEMLEEVHQINNEKLSAIHEKLKL